MFSMDRGSGESCGYAVVALRGELDIADAAAVAAALAAVAVREPRIIVDLAGLEFIDASGIGALSRGRRHARDHGGDLLLAAPQRQVRLVLAILWEPGGRSGVHASVARAAASIGAARLAVVPTSLPPAKMPRQRMAVNALAPNHRAVTGDWLDTGSRVPGCRPSTTGGLSG
jgi:anti-anti-sigma factor